MACSMRVMSATLSRLRPAVMCLLRSHVIDRSTITLGFPSTPTPERDIAASHGISGALVVVPRRALRAWHDPCDIGVLPVLGHRLCRLPRPIGAARLLFLASFLSRPLARPFVLCGS